MFVCFMFCLCLVCFVLLWVCLINSVACVFDRLFCVCYSCFMDVFMAWCCLNAVVYGWFVWFRFVAVDTSTGYEFCFI